MSFYKTGKKKSQKRPKIWGGRRWNAKVRSARSWEKAAAPLKAPGIERRQAPGAPKTPKREEKRLNGPLVADRPVQTGEEQEDGGAKEFKGRTTDGGEQAARSVRNSTVLWRRRKSRRAKPNQLMRESVAPENLVDLNFGGT